jgi:hypothetical protein
MFENEVKLVRILSHAGVKGINIINPYQNIDFHPVYYIKYLIGTPKFYDSFRISENESVLLMEKLG